MTSSGTPLVSQLAGVGVAELVRREPTTEAGEDCGAVELLGSGGLLPVPSGGCTWITQSNARGAKAGAELKPRLELRPAPAIMPTTRRRPPFPRRTRTAPRARFEIGLGEVKHLADPKARTPQEHDQRPLEDR
jgi:hypothetical protein